ncbi:MAG: DNA polymerase I [Firmicutes bacterium]|nr:DNA polymerase I [Bacillota bacterium]
MQKIILVDGNNLLFRSYYATAYNGNFMKNSKGFPTNALFGFTNMINKIISEENPTHMIVAFDKGKTFRHDKYETYKDGRLETPNELKQQFPIAKEMLTHMGIKYYEIDNYEADDILGTFAKFCDLEEDFVGTIISSDKDLLQLISTDVDIKLLKQKDYIRYNEEKFREEYGIDPIRIIDLKALMGDPSDNIPGVKGVGEKTALKLLQQYGSIDNIYNNIDSIKGAIHDKLVMDKENAYMSYDLATIVRDVPMEININDVIVKNKDIEALTNLYEDLEFYSFLKKEKEVKIEKKEVDAKIVTDIKELDSVGDCAIYLELLGTNYHKSEILGMGIYNDDISYFVPYSILKQQPKMLTTINKYTYDSKKVFVSLKWHNIDIENVSFDTMIAGSLLDYNVKDDIAYLANQMDYNMEFYETVYGKGIKINRPGIDVIAKEAVNKAKFIFETHQVLTEKLEQEKMTELFADIELPLATVLGQMEYNGVYVDKNVLVEMGEEIKIKIDLLSQQIYSHAGCEFNISSPYQLGEILFEKLNLPHGKKSRRGYSTAIDVLHKLSGEHPIVDLVIEHRALTKLYSTYIEGLIDCIMPDNKIHTIYTQVLTRTGRLSSIEPNLQNIPIRSEYGKLIRKAFIPSTNSVIMSADYSQIELRILAHMADVPALREAFIEGKDIHTKTASDIFHVSIDLVNSNMRRIAKAVNFGIIYGISGYGLSENIGITPGEAKKFIDDYLNTYPGIQKYMDDTIASAHKYGFVHTMFNRKRNIPELNNENYLIRNTGERIALNTPIQGTSADIIKKAMVEIDRIFKDKNLDCKMILQVHDELIFDVSKSEKNEVEKIVREVMEGVINLSVPLKVDIESGENWYQAK